MGSQVLFEDALETALQLVRNAGATLGSEVNLVRDLRGRIRVVLSAKPPKIGAFPKTLSKALGKYGYPPPASVLYETDLLAGPAALPLGDRRLLDDGPTRIYLIDRQVTGHDWMRQPLVRRTKNARVTMFGIKGGVGRSTALALWAIRLAREGKRVLVMDFDLESPGVSSTLLPLAERPDYGIVDWFVEDSVGQADLIQRDIVAPSPISRNLRGEILVTPAYGGKTGRYLPKLARCYSELGGGVPVSWADRVQSLVENMELATTPDLVILDSRAGLHDIAAVLVTRMDADTMLFAVDSAQTWAAYRLLFRHWRDNPDLLGGFRNRLQVVAALVPETGQDRYKERFLLQSWEAFRDFLYDDITSSSVDPFSFDHHDEEAPHAPWHIYWRRALQEFDPFSPEDVVNDKIADEAVGELMERARHLTLEQK